MKKTRSLLSCLRPADAVVCLLVFALAVVLLCMPLLRGAGEELVITVGGTSTRYSLADNRELTLTNGGYILTVCIANGEAWVSESDCPEGVCRRTGKISRAGESILCSRADILLRIPGEGGYDAVAG
ncbi:MAG: NusG domain II-containing protein [Clostridia bacterium]|nr:NusG domain II-containing protein [Clostridia bacterium]